MSVRVHVAPAVRAVLDRSSVRRLQRALERAASRLGVGPTARSLLGVRIVDDAEIAGLRLRHLGEHGPTDVLSFAASDLGSTELQLAAHSGLGGGGLGDLVISWDAVVRQSGLRGGDRAARVAEAADLLIHGLAHLLGHDHAGRTEGRAMLRVEARGTRAAGVAMGPRPYRHRRGPT